MVGEHVFRWRRGIAVVLAALVAGQLLALAGALPAASATTVLHRINSGGGQLSGEPVWAADTKVSPSPYVNSSQTNTTFSTGATIDVSHASVPAGTPANVFKTERWDKAGGAELQYAIPVPSGQAVEVRLYFSENYAGAQAVGARVFDVAVDGVVRVDDLDVFAEVGGFAGYVETIPVTSDGTVDITFVHQVENPSVKGIEIVTTGTVEPSDGSLSVTPASLAFGQVEVGTPATQSVTIANSAPSGASDVVVSSASITGTSASSFSHSFAAPATLSPGEQLVVAVTFAPAASGAASATLTFAHDGANGPQAVSLSGTGSTPTSSGEVLHRVNSGGPALVGDPTWSADTKAAPSPYVNAAETNVTTTNSGTVDTSDPSIPVGTPAALFNSERWDKPGGAELRYSFPVPAGQVTEVRLFFAETYAGAQAVGARVFDVAVDGVVRIDDLDVFAEVGAGKGIAKALLITSDGTVDITFIHQVENPAVKGIELVAADAQPGGLGVQPTSLSLPPTTPGSSTSATAQLRNLGGAGDPSITVTSTSITGTDAAVFSDDFNDAADAVLAPGATHDVRVTFSPTASGPRTASLVVNHTGQGSPLVVPLSGSTVQVGFQPKAPLGGAAPSFPTSIDWGPDGRLYVATMFGTVHAYQVARNGPGSYSVLSTETITLIRDMPNRNDDGVLNAAVTGRLVTGIDVVGTAASPVIYAVSSDPRIGGGTDGTDLPLDTNSGILSRLTKSGGTWSKLDLVRGLPRSKENHTGNGLVVDQSAGTVYIAYGGNTNKGAPSFNFANLSEYALSAAILSVDLDAIGNTTYDLPTLDDEDRPGTNDANDPFGGNRGKNQARLVPGGPVQAHSPGWRNPYDLVITEAGRMYSIDNGGNAGWGGFPLPDNTSGTCTNDAVNTSDSDPDALVLIPGAGFYGGHPNPVRANPAITFNSSNPQSPVSSHNPVECDYRDPASQRGAIKTWGASTNGLAEYTTDNFGGALRGSLLAASYDNTIQVVHLNGAGTAATSSGPLFSSVGALPLDVIASRTTDPFPGVIVVADAQANTILFFEPNDYDGGGTSCTGADDASLDEDGDGFDNHDEILNGTNPCSAADIPPDHDGDSASDLVDPDDDNDGVLDVNDPFAIDAANGRSTPLPVQYGWENDGSNPGGFLNLGFTGHMTNGTQAYLDQFDPAGMTAGGAAGVTTVDSVGAGTAHGASNNQLYGLQFGIDVNAASAPFIASTALVAPFNASPVTPGQEYGLFFGTGTQSDYVEVVASTAGGGTLIARKEVGGVLTTVGQVALSLPGPGDVALSLRIDPAAATAEAMATIDGGAPVVIGTPFAIPAGWFTAAAGPAVGIISTSAGSTPFTATWDYIHVVPDGTSPPPPTTTVVHRVNSGGAQLSGTPVWSVDTKASPSPYVNASQTNKTFSVSGTIDTSHPSVPAGTPASLFNTERFDAAGGAELRYSFPVPAGRDVQVRMYFAENYTGAQKLGGRVFDVTVDGVLEVNDLDVFAEVGASRGYVETVSTTSDGSVDVEFIHQVENPSIKGIEVLEVGGSTPPPSEQASTVVQVNTNNTLLKSSTYTPGSFQVTNASTDASKIASIRFDLSTSLLPDVVFDPSGGAGDLVGKDLAIDSGGTDTGAQAHAFSGPHDDGFDVLTIPFTDFGPNETVTFSVDVDPTSIRGSAQPGPNDSGSISGFELSGATVTVQYVGGSTQVTRLFRTPGSLVNSRAVLTAATTPIPTISIAGVTTPANVPSSSVTVDVTGGVPGSTVRIVAAEAGLYTDGVAGGGYDIDPFEANTVVNGDEKSVVLDGTGAGSMSFTLARTSASDGIWHFIAATALPGGDTGPSSNVQVVRYTG